MIDLDVLFLGPARDFAGQDSVRLQVRNGTTIAALRMVLAERFEGLRDALETIRFAVNEAFAAEDTVLQGGDEVALIPPVSGGCGAGGAWVDLVHERIDTARVRGFVHGAYEAGGIVTFEGATRRDVDGVHGAITRLEYEAYGAMARQQLERLAEEAKARWSAFRVAIIHRVGSVPVGDVSVMIAVACGHRDEAFQACRGLIDALKKDVPIWKRDVYEDGFERWVRPAGESS